MDGISNKISTVRKSNNLTQKDLAERLNVSPQAVSKWENGTPIPDIQQLKNIASLFNLSMDELVGNNNTNKTKEEYTVTFKRADQFFLINLPMHIFINGKEVGTVKNGCVVGLTVNEKKLDIMVKAAFRKCNIETEITGDSMIIDLRLLRSSGEIRAETKLAKYFIVKK